MPAHAADSLAAFHKNDLILFQGDSITDGGRMRTGNDYNHIMGQSYPYIIAAEVGAQYPERNLTFVNRGISGNTVVNLAARWQKDTLALKPQFLSILIGVNDTHQVGGPEDLDTFQRTYDKLLSDTIAALPGTKIILGEPFLLPVGGYKTNYDAKLAEVKKHAAVVAALAEKYHLPLVRFQKAFDEGCEKAPADHWSWDGVHPTYAGHGLMVQAWLDAVNRAWPSSP